MTARPSTWYWRIWWWCGYHGLYQINWWWKRQFRFYVGGRLTVQTAEEEAQLFWCSPRWIITRYRCRRFTCWRVPQIATTARVGRWEVQRLHITG